MRGLAMAMAMLVACGGPAPPPAVVAPATASTAAGLRVEVSGPFAVHAIDPITHAVRWTRDVAGDARDDPYALRDSLQVAATGAGVVLAFPVRRRVGDSWQYEEVVAALDAKTGAETWRATTVSHAVGEPMMQGGTVLLAATATRVYARTSGALLALDAATGRVVWTHTWTPLVRAGSAPGLVWRAPLVAADDAISALAVPGRIELFDASTGRARGVVAVDGRATAIVASPGALVVALEVQPGTASVVAIDTTTTRVRWTRPVAYSVADLRVAGARVQVVDGNDRTWDLDATTGAPRTTPPPTTPFARWQVARDGDHCGPRALDWVDGEDRIAWTAALPVRMRALSFGACDEQELAAYLRAPRRTAALLYEVLGIAELGTTLLVGDVTGVLALRASDGAAVLDIGTTTTRRFLFDAGTFAVAGLPACTGAAPAATVWARCGDHFIYFNGATALVLAVAPLRLEARGELPTTGTAYANQGVHTHITVPVGPYSLVLDGTTFMH